MEKNDSSKVLQNLRFGNIKERTELINCVDGKVHSISKELIEALDEAIEMLVEKDKKKAPSRVQVDSVKSDEVLHLMLRAVAFNNTWGINKERIIAINEAIRALKEKEKYKYLHDIDYMESHIDYLESLLQKEKDKKNEILEWLDNEIENSEKYPDTHEASFYYKQVKEMIN